MPMRFVTLMSLMLLTGASAAVEASQERADSRRCHFAIYKLADGRLLDIGAAEGGDLRWRMQDGRTGQLAAADHWKSTLGWTKTPDGVVVEIPSCDSNTIAFTDETGHALTGTRVPLGSSEAEFQSQGANLFGRLVLPEGTQAVPIIVEVHGSERDAATDFDFRQRLFPAQGIGVYVFDKRGTGRSGGKYTQDFEILANDVVAAAAEARRLAGARAGSVGLQGASQGGWVAPLAATKIPVDFVIVDYGLAGSPAEENRDQTVLELARQGYGPVDLAAAGQVADAANQVVGSHFRSGFDSLDAVREQYGTRPWFKTLHGQFTGEVVDHADWLLRLFGPRSDVGTPVFYDALEALRRVKAPMLWVLAGDDTFAPNATTQQRLAGLLQQGRNITALVFPHTDHGILEYVAAANGTRVTTRYADGFFQTTVDFARNRRLPGTYGAAKVLLRPKLE